jgi:hypothetical protein
VNGLDAELQFNKLIFQVSLLEIRNWIDADQFTGRIVHVPDHKEFSEPLANDGRGTRVISHEMLVLLTLESHWEEAKRGRGAIATRHNDDRAGVAHDDLRRASSRFLLYDLHLEPGVFTSVDDSGILLTMRYLTELRRRRATSEAIWKDILRVFGAHDDIDVAYLTIRTYDNPPRRQARRAHLFPATRRPRIGDHRGRASFSGAGHTGRR